MELGDDAAKSIESARQRLLAGEFAFVDGGCGSGGSIAYCEKVFKTGRGLGIDSSAAKVEKARGAGHVAYQADLTAISLPPKSVQFVSFLDFLEHLPQLDLARAIVANMQQVARDFLFIRHPNFDDIEYLETFGLKLDWTDWHGHRNMMTLADLELLIRDLGLPAPTILGQKPIADSDHPSIVPLSAPQDTVGYDPARHAVKQKVRFDRPIYSQFDVFIRLDPDMAEAQWQSVTRSVFDRRNATTEIDGRGRV